MKQPNLNINAQNYQGETALIMATRNGDHKIVKVLCSAQNGEYKLNLKMKIDLNLQNEQTFTALMYANARIAEFFLQQQNFYLDVNQVNADGNNVLTWAVK